MSLHTWVASGDIFGCYRGRDDAQPPQGPGCPGLVAAVLREPPSWSFKHCPRRAVQLWESPGQSRGHVVVSSSCVPSAAGLFMWPGPGVLWVIVLLGGFPTRLLAQLPCKDQPWPHGTLGPAPTWAHAWALFRTFRACLLVAGVILGWRVAGHTRARLFQIRRKKCFPKRSHP